jgi:hypothetical protein
MGIPEEDQEFERRYRVPCRDGDGMRDIYTGAFLTGLTDLAARIRGESALDLGLGLVTRASFNWTPWERMRRWL